MTSHQLVLEERSSLDDAIERGGVWRDWPGGKVEPAPPPFLGDLVTERMSWPHKAPAPFNPMSVMAIANAVIRGRALLANASGELSRSTELLPLYINHWIENQAPQTAAKPLNELNEVALPGVSALVHHCHDIYGHWLVEGLPKLLYLNSLPVRPQRFIVQASALAHISKWIGLIAPDIPIHYYDEEREFVRCEMLLTASMACSPRYVFNPRISGLFDTVTVRRQSDRLIYLDRIFPGFHHWMLNAEEVRSTAESFGFEVYLPQHRPLQEQIETFASARVLVGDYGSALHNSLFSPPSTCVLAFNWVTQIQARIAQLRDQHFGFQLGDSHEPLVGVGYRMDIEAAKRALDAVLRLAGRPPADSAA